jgi:hypothetical protein
MRDRRLTPSRDGRYRTAAAKQEYPLSSQCPLADPLTAASKKVRRKRGAGKPGDYDAILPTARARRGGFFLTARRKNFAAGAHAPELLLPNRGVWRICPQVPVSPEPAGKGSRASHNGRLEDESQAQGPDRPPRVGHT